MPTREKKYGNFIFNYWSNMGIWFNRSLFFWLPICMWFHTDNCLIYISFYPRGGKKLRHRFHRPFVFIARFTIVTDLITLAIAGTDQNFWNQISFAILENWIRLEAQRINFFFLFLCKLTECHLALASRAKKNRRYDNAMQMKFSYLINRLLHNSNAVRKEHYAFRFTADYALLISDSWPKFCSGGYILRRRAAVIQIIFNILSIVVCTKME